MSLLHRQFSASPVLTASPHAAHHHPGVTGIRSMSYPVPSIHDQFNLPNAPPDASPAATAAAAAAAAAAAMPRGRKRSRDEAAINLDSFSQHDPPSPDRSPLSSGNSTQATLDFNSGQSPMLPPTPPAQEDRPVLRSHKSQRLDQAAIAQSYLAKTGGIADGVPDIPVVDDFTLHLGIGWRRISQDVDIQAAARGWARYIENHYPLSAVTIRLESKGLQSYLVEAAEGYFLFAENLRHGRLVGHDVGTAIANLQTSPPSFAGEEMAARQAMIGSGNGSVGPVSSRTEMDTD